ncbi:ribonuclease R [Verrucomicrobiaceae bacterium N1E253]|uniref:Ribonuclease R n=1 Tax=Oceaniferula marina TaxID=2748318 RepID=A0A851GSU5_9BACT|nr:ribonuclease R [Oceaniferula marina]NWK57324.1 ribonuclease R [Oceaniferula marina]
MKDLKKRILTLMSSSDFKPLNKSEFARTLGISSNHRAALRAELIKLENKGDIVRGKKGRFSLRAKSKKGSSGTGSLLVGTLRFQQSGHAWFYPDANDATNEAAGMDLQKYSRVFIPSTKTSTAMNGDQVTVRIDRIGPPDWTKHRKNRQAGGKKPDDEAAGYVTKVIKRGMARIVGTYFHHGKFSHVQPNDVKIPDVNIDRQAQLPDPKPKPGQIVAVELTRWDNPNSTPMGRVTEVLGWPDTPGIDMLAIVHKLGLRSEFPDDVLAQAKGFGDRVSEKDIRGRDDWRELPVITIDPHDAKDFDDAISVQQLKSGDWQLAVHIADVSHYVKPGTPLDKEARARGNSTYMADRVLPMIPRELSNHLCSLMPDVDRLTQCCLMRVAQDGKIKSAKFTRAVINSGRRFTYEEAQDILMESDKVLAQRFPDEEKEIVHMMRQAWKLASILRKRRFDQGALDLDMPEVRVTLDDTGKPTGIERSDYNESHQLIEEFMLVANEAAAKLLKNRSQTTIYRVHEDPDPDRLNEYAELARLHGYQPGDLTNKKHIQELLDKAKGTIEEPAIKIGLLKSLKRAAYHHDPLGHYGLSKADYCHFTSPIRRYADLIVHRALQRHLGNPPETIDKTPPPGEAAQIAVHISDTERNSAEAENESRRLKMLQYLHICSREENPPTFTAVVTEVRHFGLFIEATDIMTKGMIKTEDFPDADRSEWLYDPTLLKYSGPRGQELGIGQQHQVQVAHVDMELQRVDFRIVDS